MKKLIHYLTVCLAAVTIFTACNKKDDDNPGGTTTTACNGKNLCMKIDGTELSQDAKWKTLPDGRTRILWEEGSGTSYKNIELDIYGTTTGTYNVAAKPSSGQAGFQYFVANPSNEISGESGTVELTSNANNTLTGKFTITAKDSKGATVQITEGNFVSVPQ